MTQGYFLIANGKVYSDMTIKYTIPNIRFFDKLRPITILTNTPELFDAKKFNIIHYNPERVKANLQHLNCSDFFLLGTIPKLIMFDLTPYDETVYFDSDALSMKPIEEFWTFSKNTKKQFVIAGGSDEKNNAPSDWHWNTIDEVIAKCKNPIPRNNGGVIYWKKSNDFWNTIEPYIMDPEKYAIKPWFRGSLPDEIFISIYLGIKGIRPEPDQNANPPCLDGIQLYRTHYSEEGASQFFHIFNKACLDDYWKLFLNKNQTVAGFYQCHKQPKSFYLATQSFLKHYSSSTCIVVNDGGLDYSQYCANQNIDYSYWAKQNTSNNALYFNTKESVILFFKRFYDSLKRIKESHVILLEDDVRIIRKHRNPFRFTINGCNINGRSLHTSMIEKLKATGYAGPYHYGGCGGCVLDVQFFLNIPFTTIERFIYELNIPTYASDMVMSYIVLMCGGTIGKYDEFAETWYTDFNNLLKEDKIAFLHQYKYDYNKELNADEKKALNM